MSDRPDQTHDFRGGVVTLVFTDVVGSTALKQQLGDKAGLELLQRHHKLLRQALAQFAAAREINTAGDSFFLIFTTPSEAVSFALLLQARLHEFNSGSATPVQDRIGIHLGEVRVEGGEQPIDLHGLSVDLCARVMSLAGAGQILMTRPVFDNARQSLKGAELEAAGALTWLNHGRFELKGIDEPVDVCEVRASAAAHLAPPTTSEKAHRVEVEGEAVLGWRPAVGQVVPNTKWVLEEKLGEGGFGEVWKARHEKLNQDRVFKFCFRADRVRSLKREVTLFRLLKEHIGEHPNIVKLYDINFDAPPYYLEEEYVAGKDLRSWCEAQGGADKVPFEVKLDLVAQAADALQASHDSGVIHRDVKPGNILVAHAPGSRDLRPSAKLTDFGIGQVISQEVLAGVTRAGFTQTMLSSASSPTGTHLYLAPELLEGKPASTRSDVYSLGVVLFQLLVGDFGRSITTDWTKHIPDPLLREDLGHCFAGSPEERFPGAAQLARNLRDWKTRTAELARVQADRAERESLKEQAQRRRRMLMAAATAGLVLIALTVALGYGLKQAEREREHQRRLAYASDMKAAQVALQQNNRGLVLELLQRHVPSPGQSDLRGIEWRYLWTETRGTETCSLPHSVDISDVAFSPDGRLLATSDFYKSVQVWDIATEKPVREFEGGGTLSPKRGIAFTPDGKRFLLRGKGGLEVRETSGWTLLTNLPCAANSPIALSGNGRVVVLHSAGEMQAWDLQTWDCRKLSGTNAFMFNLAVNPEGTLVALSTAFTWQAPLVLWDVAANSATPLMEMSDTVSLAFSPDGKWLACGHYSGQIQLWDLGTRSRARSWRAHQGLVYGLAFAPDSSRLASGGNDQLILLWETGTTNCLLRLPGHENEILCLAFSRDGRRLASGSKDRRAKIWDLQERRSRPELAKNALPAGALALRPSADGTGLFTLDEKENTVSLWSFQSGQPVWSFSGRTAEKAGCKGVAYFLEPQLAFGFSTNRVLHIWEMASQKLKRSLPLPFPSLEPTCVSRDQHWLLAETDKVRLFDLEAGQSVPGFGFRYLFFYAADFSPDGRLLAWSAGKPKRNDIHIFDLKERKERNACRLDTWCGSLRFSPDSRLLAAANWSGEVRVFSAQTGELLATLKGHQSAVTTCSFSNDGKTLITSGPDFTLRFWSLAAGQEMLVFQRAVSISAGLVSRFGLTYRGQAEIQPAPDTLVWQDLRDGPRRIVLPSLSEIDREMFGTQQKLAEQARRTEKRDREEDSRLAAVGRDPGAIKDWLVLGPIPLRQGQTEIEGLDAELVKDEARLQPRPGDTAQTAGGVNTWRAVRLNDYSMDFNDLFGQVSEHVAVYAVCYVSASAPCSNIKLLVGSDDQAKIYWNGHEVYRQIELGKGNPDQDTVSGIELKAGRNVLVFKVVNGTGQWGGSVRVADTEGRPIPGLSVALSPR